MHKKSFYGSQIRFFDNRLLFEHNHQTKINLKEGIVELDGERFEDFGN